MGKKQKKRHHINGSISFVNRIITNVSFNSLTKVLFFFVNLHSTFNFRQVETEILDSVMGPAVYDSRIRPSGINGSGKKTSIGFYVQQRRAERE